MRRLRPFLVPIIIFSVTAVLAALLWARLLPNLLFTIRIDMGFLLLILGGLCSGLWTAYLIFSQRGSRSAIETVRRDSADEKRRFLQRLDHELKNPLTAIRAGLANLAETGLQDPQMQTLSSVEAQSLRLSRLSSDLRKLAELETRPLERAPVNVTGMLQEAFNLAQDQPTANGRELKLTVPHAPWPLPAIQGDHDLLFLAVHNLIDNAVKFTRPGNTIEVRSFEDGASLVIEVADTGQGIPADELAHVGEELYRGRLARGIPGNGLGLALVHAIVHRHGGQIHLRSREGQGTVVTMRLPIS
jgi:two-component system OmpR family sensor kinase